MQAENLSCSRNRGLFAGINFKGVIVKPEDAVNKVVYGKKARALLGVDGQAGW